MKGDDGMKRTDEILMDDGPQAFDPAAAVPTLQNGIVDGVQRLARRGLVVAVSGGVDSGVVAALSAGAIGAAHVMLVGCPTAASVGSPHGLGCELAEMLGAPTVEEPISPMLQALGCYRRQDEAIREVFDDYEPGWPYKLVRSAPTSGMIVFSLVVERPDGRQERRRLHSAAHRALLSATNMKQRVRKLIEYAWADKLHYAVAGTPNLLEYDQGFFVKGGDGLADIKPIAGLYKQVFAPAISGRPGHRRPGADDRDVQPAPVAGGVLTGRSDAAVPPPHIFTPAVIVSRGEVYNQDQEPRRRRVADCRNPVCGGAQTFSVAPADHAVTPPTRSSRRLRLGYGSTVRQTPDARFADEGQGMAITTRDQHEDALRTEPPRHSAIPVEAHGPPAEAMPHRLSSVAAAAAHVAMVFLGLIVVVLVARSFLGPVGDARLEAALAVGLVFALICAVAGALQVRGAVRPRRRMRRPTRIAVIGNQTAAVAIEQELAINRISAYTSVGWIAAGNGSAPQFPLPQALGGVPDLASLVEDHQIDLLLIASDVPRLHVFDELVRLTDLVPVRVCELSAFYEDAFGHIPVAEINSAWFQYVMHPKFRPPRNRFKRAFDILVSAAIAIVVLPLMLLSVLLIKLGGGSVLYRQQRIGEKGRPFTMYKLRTMRECGRDEAEQTWCGVQDPRVTRVGCILRRLHIDELPQLYNVLRGEMSIVGPRPEQPCIVSRLELGIAFYSRRHLIKPGLAGWAQLRCGYARSEQGSAWKLSHDLYYLKHQSLRFDTMILIRTFLTLTSQVAKYERRESSFVTEPVNAFTTSL